MNPQTLKEYVVVQTPDEIDFWKTDRWQQFVASRGGAPHGYRIITTFNASDELKDSPYQGSAGAVKILKQLCELKRYKDTLGKDSFYEKRQPELWKLANDFLNGIADSAATPAGHGWNATAEQLPPKNELVLVVRENGYMLCKVWEPHTNQDEAWFREHFTHWRPLPSPPNKSV